MRRINYCRELCIEGTEPAKNYIRGTFDDERVDKEFSQLRHLLDYSMSGQINDLIKMLQKKMI